MKKACKTAMSRVWTGHEQGMGRVWAGYEEGMQGCFRQLCSRIRAPVIKYSLKMERLIYTIYPWTALLSIRI